MSKNRNRSNTDLMVIEETPSVETPSVETPSVETPSVETPSVETPSVEEIIEESSPTNVTSEELADPAIEESTPEGEVPSNVGLLSDLFFGRPSEAKMRRGEVVKWEKLFCDIDFNIRDKEISYTPEALAILNVQLADGGQEESMMVSLQRDGRYRVLRGNRRYKVMEGQRNADIKEVSTGKLDKTDVRWQYVLARVKTGLTPEQETILMMDHTGRVGLTPAEIFEACVRLERFGWTETQIKRKLGLKENERGKMTGHYRVATMPDDVKDAYRKYLKGDKDTIRFTKEVVDSLYTARTKDNKSKAPTAFGGGPEFKTKWQEVKGTAGQTATRGAGPKKTAEKIAQRFANDGHPLLVNLMNHVLEKTEGIPNLDDIMTNLTKACVAMYPIVVDEDNDHVNVTEEGITREI